jgi:uncharacterized protein (UPF0261 family)
MLFAALREKLQPQVKCVEVDLHINDPEFGRALASDLISLIK